MNSTTKAYHSLLLLLSCWLLAGLAHASHKLSWEREIPAKSHFQADEKLDRIFVGVKATSSTAVYDREGKLLWQAYSDLIFDVSRDGDRVWVSSGALGRILDGATGKTLVESEDLRGVAYIIRGEYDSSEHYFSPDGKTLYSAEVEYFDEDQFEPGRRLTTAVDTVSGKVLWRNDKDLLLQRACSMPDDGSLVLCDRVMFDRSGKVLWLGSGADDWMDDWKNTLERHPGRLWSPSGDAGFQFISRDGRYLINRGNMLAIRQDDPAKPWRQVKFPIYMVGYTGFAFSDDYRYLARVTDQWNVSGKPPFVISLLKTTDRISWSLAWSKDLQAKEIKRGQSERFQAAGVYNEPNVRFLKGDRIWVTFRLQDGRDKSPFDDVYDLEGRLLKRIILPGNPSQRGFAIFRQLDNERYAYVIKRIVDEEKDKAKLELWTGNFNEPD